LALGLADDLIGLVVLATAAPVLVAPAMEDHMFHHPATQQHLATLASRSVAIVGPVEGRLASAPSGVGRMPDPEAIISAALKLMTTPTGPLAGKKVVVT